MRKLFFLWMVLCFHSAFAEEFCVQVYAKETAYQEDLSKAVTKEEKAVYKKLLSEEKNLIKNLLEQVGQVLEKNREHPAIVSIFKNACWVINHTPKYANTMMSYSANVDPMFSPRDQTLYSKSHPDSTIRLNVTEKMVKLLMFAKKQRGDNDQIQPVVIGFAGSYLLRNAVIANTYMKTPMRDLVGSFKNGKKVLPSDILQDRITKMVSDHRSKVELERYATSQQQKFLDSFIDDGLLDWVSKVQPQHPEFFEEKLFTFKNGKFTEVSAMLLDGQYRVGEIIREIYVLRTAYKADMSADLLQKAKERLTSAQNEWNTYINDSPLSKDVLQGFVMEGTLAPFMERYDQEVASLPDFLK